MKIVSRECKQSLRVVLAFFVLANVNLFNDVISELDFQFLKNHNNINKDVDFIVSVLWYLDGTVKTWTEPTTICQWNLYHKGDFLSNICIYLFIYLFIYLCIYLYIYLFKFLWILWQNFWCIRLFCPHKNMIIENNFLHRFLKVI